VIESWIGAEPAVDVNDVTDARAVAVLSVPPYSSALEIGPGQRSVARALAARGCRVWSIDTDGSAIEAIAPWCEGTVVGDVEHVDLAGLFVSQRVETILLLGGYEHLADPGGAIARVLSFLAPGGRLVVSCPHPAGPRAVGRHQLDEVFRGAGIRVIDEASVTREGEGAQLLVAVAGDGARTLRLPGLAGVLTEHLQRVTDRCRSLEMRSRDLAAEAERYRCERDRLEEEVDEAREWHRQSARAVSDVKEALQHANIERQRLERLLESKIDELSRCQRERRFFRDDVMVKDAYLATLREEAAIHHDTLQRQEALCRQEAQRREQLAEALHNVSGRLDTAAAERAAERQRADDLARCNEELREQVRSVQQELHRVHTAIAHTVAQPRYLVADRLNGWLKGLQFVHGPLKRAWLARTARKA
jgi:SAM-dependent methyltransferase